MTPELMARVKFSLTVYGEEQLLGYEIPIARKREELVVRTWKPVADVDSSTQPVPV